ncbi:methyltransferase [Streptomyces phage Spilled]|uniref:Methyltransferase n=1 Tax=Streptomyces phage Karimac TaxID=2283303 RepID=A0A345MHD4_9CAUD|nr:methyltransferase [Streptomyces phage Karimac]AXH69965.1 methyltransferase [Streptomyces phage Karimac]UVK59995.1 methyltransferase [Streptomyces phage Spilled]
MRYNSRQEVERAGERGAKSETDEYGTRYWMLDSFWMYAEDDDYAMTPHFAAGRCYWESWVTAYISQRVEPDAVFVDVGANLGYYSLWAATHGCNVFAFEPNQDLWMRLYHAKRLNGAKIYQGHVALGDSWEPTERILYIPEGHSGGANMYGASGNYTMQHMYVQSFDNAVPIPRDYDGTIYVKIDAEGAEPEIFAGMKWCWKQRSMVLFMEWDISRYDKSFGEKLLDSGKVSLIEYDGTARELDLDGLLSLKELRMIVVENNK